MNTTTIRAVLIIFALAQLTVLLLPRIGPEKFRAREFATAFIAWNEKPSVETERTWQEELSLRKRHKGRIALLILGVFLVVNGLLWYRFWNYGKHQNAA